MMVKESICPALLLEIPVTDIVTCDVGPMDSSVLFCCVYRSPNSSSTADLLLITLLLSRFEFCNRIILMAGLNVGNINWDTLSHVLASPFKRKLVSFAHETVTLQHKLSIKICRSDTIPSLLSKVCTQDDFHVFYKKSDISFGRNDHLVIQFCVTRGQKATATSNIKLVYQGVVTKSGHDYANTLDLNINDTKNSLALAVIIKNHILCIDSCNFIIKTIKFSLRPAWFN